jgi:hypothetical protein
MNYKQRKKKKQERKKKKVSESYFVKNGFKPIKKNSQGGKNGWARS